MNILEARKKLNDNGIYQLNKGESLADALDHVENGSPRKGYKVKADNGRQLSKNEIIANENSIAFHKSFTPKIYSQDEVEGIDDITSDMDFREDKSERGVILNCFYCGDCMRVDAEQAGDDEDYGEPIDTLHCEDCMSDAISRLAM